jgi:hypothetical protein
MEIEDNKGNFTVGIRKFAFSIYALTLATVFSWLMKYEGTVYVQLFAVVTTGYLVAQAAVDWKGREDVLQSKK